MNDAQRAAYWQHYARQHEARWKSMSDYDDLKAKSAELDQIKAANMTEQQKAVAEAEQRGRQEGRQAALKESGAKLVEQFFRAALTNRKTEDEIQSLIGPLDKSYFLSPDGLGVDADKVAAFANSVAPPAPAVPAAPAAPAPPPAAPTAAPTAPATGTARKVPDMGQGTQQGTKPSGLEAGRLIAQARFGKNNQPAQ